MKSKFENICKTCAEKIEIGSEIEKNSFGQWVHAHCSKTTPQKYNVIAAIRQNDLNEKSGKAPTYSYEAGKDDGDNEPIEKIYCPHCGGEIFSFFTGCKCGRGF